MLITRAAERPWGAAALATVLTAAGFAALLSSAPGAGFLPMPRLEPRAAERLDYVVPLPVPLPVPAQMPIPAPEAAVEEVPGGRSRVRARAGAAAGSAGAATGVLASRATSNTPRSWSGVPAGAPVLQDSIAGAGAEAVRPRTPAAASPALLGPRAAASITGRGALPARAVRDSINAAFSARVPALAAARKATQAERDEAWRASASREREARREGRPMPAGDPTKAGAMMSGKAGTVTISVPLFSPGPSKKQRMRDSATWKTNKVLMQRLQARLDSIRADSVRRAVLHP